MDLHGVNELLAQHHVIAILAAAGFAWRLVRPFLVDGRSAFVELVAIGRVIAKRNGVTDAEIAAEREEAGKRIPEVPDAFNGAAGILGSSSERKAS